MIYLPIDQNALHTLKVEGTIDSKFLNSKQEAIINDKMLTIEKV